MDHRKITAGLLSVMEDLEQPQFEIAETHFRTMAVYGAAAASKDLRVSLLLRCEPDANLNRHEDHGIIINERKGRVRTAILPVGKVGHLSEDSAVHQLAASRYLNILMDNASVAVDLPKFQKSSFLSGKNVVLGIIDTGIDSSHPAFAGRILRIWDQTMRGSGVPEGPYGKELLTDEFALSADTIGHGTHVAGIAGGNDKTYAGVALNAEYVIVKTDLSEAHLVNAVNYVFRVARELNRPAVVNLSMGGHFDPHDGTDLLSLYLDSQTGPGRIVCCAAGNEGQDFIHTSVSLKAGEARVRFGLWPSTPMAGLKAELNGWYAGADSFEVSVVDPAGNQTEFQEIIASGSYNRNCSLPQGLVRISTPGPDPGNGDHNFRIQVQPLTIPEDLENQTSWWLVLRAKSVTKGRVDIWAACDAVFEDSAAAREMKIGAPGCCSSAVTVAAYTTKNQWIDIQKRHQTESLTLNTLTPLSSPGPLRNGAEKPDVAAPGALIAAPASSRATVDDRLIVAKGFYLNAGTSMATPFVSGIAALLLERDPGLTPSGFKKILRSAGAIPGMASGTFDPQWGYGLLNALKL